MERRSNNRIRPNNAVRRAKHPAAHGAVRHSVHALPALTRRQFLVGAAGVAAAAATGVGAYSFATKTSGSANAARAGLSVPEGNVFTTQACEYKNELKGNVSLRTRASLPYGTILTCSSDDVAVCLVPSETVTPLLTVALLHLGSGKTTPALKGPAGAADGFQINDARGNESGLVWTESNMQSGAWRVYTATVDGASVGDPVLAAENDGNCTLPSLSASDTYAWWQTVVKGQASGASAGVPGTAGTGTLSCVSFGESASTAVVALEAPGGFACAPYPADNGVCTCLRTVAKGKVWQLVFAANPLSVTPTDAASESVPARTPATSPLTLPATMKPMEVSYSTHGFGFSLENIYNFKDGISNLGTYLPAAPLAEADASTEASTLAAYGAAEWFRYPRAPISAPAFSGDWVFVKSTNVVAAVNLAKRQYVTIPTESATQGYGEYLASTGTSKRIVTFANIDYTPMNGERLHECTVRVWEPVA